MFRCDLDTDAARLRDAAEELQTAWAEANEAWDDEVSRAFCERYLEPLGPAFKSALDTISNMRNLVNQMQRDCSDEQPA